MERLQELFRHYYNKTATAEQRKELMQLIDRAPADQLVSLIEECGELLTDTEHMLSPDRAGEVLAHILRHDPAKESVITRNGIRIWWRYAAAAVSIITIGLTLYFIYLNKAKNEPLGTSHQHGEDVAPGSYKAKLVLADGRTVILDSMLAGEVSREGNTSVVYRNGRLVYEQQNETTPSSDGYNIVSTNKGETYSLTLADGSMIFLNAASYIRFPVAFNGDERTVEMKGEVYFKVAKNPAVPFIVSVNDMHIEALGTEFNINAYEDENEMSTTLIEGSVRVSNHQPGGTGMKEVIIKPGQQTQLKDNRLSVINDVNVEEVIAWKEGKFHFDKASLQAILRQFARWYDIEVIYEGPVSNETFFGIINRNTTLSGVLKSLQANDVQFRIEGKKLLVKSG